MPEVLKAAIPFALPTIMVAPNGARRTQADHAALPMSVADIMACARACYAAGADGLHAHVRNAQGEHVLDVGLYRELLQALAADVPPMRVQVTSEAAGRYSPLEQQAVMRALKPVYMSVALREMLPDQATATLQQAQAFYHWAAEQGSCIQHILYTADDLKHYLYYVESGLIPQGDRPHILFVLGRYAQNQQSGLVDLKPFLQLMDAHHLREALDWAVCAFGVNETACLVEAVRQGGKARIGFENNFWHADGRLARDNAERVTQLVQALQGMQPHNV